jgi:subtilisin family serine protease
MKRIPRRFIVLTAALTAIAALPVPFALSAPRGVPATRALPPGYSPSAARPAPPRTAPLGWVRGELLVVPREAVTLGIGPNARAEAADARLASALSRFGLGRAFAIGPLQEGRPARFIRLASDRADFDPVVAAEALRATGLFRAVCPNYRMHAFATLPDDTYLGAQWYVDDPGDGDVDLPEAWDLEKGSSAVAIGIMDTGVDLGHPDLAGQIWTNPGEIPGDGIDNDANGLTDDVHGWDFGNGDNDPNPQPTFDPDGIDIGFHGTFVAGIASAATNNAEGIAGAGWHCRILPLKVTDAAGEFTTAAITAAFQYAAGLRVSVLNMSFGGPGDPGVPEYFQALVDLADSAGVLCVAAAGNDGLDTPTYPAACDRVLAVAATDYDNLRTDFSNWGSWVDIAAPGTLMWSSICRNYIADDWSQIIYLFLGWDGENPYMYGDGTSFASPLVAGACGLVRNAEPGLSPQQVLHHVLVTGDTLAYDHPIGPKLNAYRAVSRAVTAVEDEAPRGPAFARVGPNPFRVETTIRFTTGSAGPVRLTIYDCAGRAVRELVGGSLPAGRHAARWDGASASGRPLASGIYFARLESSGRSARQRIALVR